MLTLGQLKQLCGITLQDPSHTTWTPTELVFYLNFAQRQLAKAARLLQTVVDLQAAPDRDPARPLALWVPADPNLTIVDWMDVWCNGEPLTRTSTRDEARRMSSWESQTGQPYRYIAGDYGQGVLRTVPMPSTAPASVRAQVSYLPVDMGADTDPPGVPDLYHEYLHDYAVARCWRRKGEKQDLAASDRYMDTWQGAVTDAVQEASAGFDQGERFVMQDWF